MEERLRELAVVFACDIGAYAVMSNHVHIVVRMDPVIAAGWSSAEVARRWLTLFGTREPRNALGQIADAVTKYIRRLIAPAIELNKSE